MTVIKNEITEIIDFDPWGYTEPYTTFVLGNGYTNGQIVLYGDYTYRYLGATGEVTTQTPDLDTTNWLQVGSSNEFSLIDGRSDTVCYGYGKIEFKLNTTGYDRITFLGLDAESITIRAALPEPEVVGGLYRPIVIEESISLINKSTISNLKEYSLQDVEYKTTASFKITPAYGSGVIVSIKKPFSELVKCTQVVAGKEFYVGETQWDINLGLSSYSKKETDEFGITSYVRRGIADLDSFTVAIDSNRVPLVKRKFKEFDAQTLLFRIVDATDYREEVNNYGYWEDFDILFSNPVKSTADITIKGVLQQ